MGKMKMHFALDIQGGIENAKYLKGSITTHEGKTLNTIGEVRAFLRGQLALGRRYLPIGDCDCFDYQKGCPGHPIPDDEEEGK